MKLSELDKRSQELIESFQNGNRNFVLDEIESCSRKIDALALLAAILEGLNSYDRNTIAAMLSVRCAPL